MATSLMKSGLRTALAESVRDAIASDATRFYYYMAGADDWASGVEDALPSPAYENEIRNEIIFMKKVQPSDVAFMVARRVWETGTVYDQYDDHLGLAVTYSVDDVTVATLSGTFDLSEFGQGWLVTGTNIVANTRVLSATTTTILLSETPTGAVTSVTITCAAASGAVDIEDAEFFVISSEDQVYKCLSNAGGAESTVEPTTTGYSPFETLDGYIWKYMYTASTTLLDTFGTVDEMPVDADNETAYPKGIYTIPIMHSGTGYDGSTVVTVTGTGTGAEATAVVESGLITSITVTTPGTGYNAAGIAITGAGTGAAAYAICTPPSGHGRNPVRELFARSLRIGADLVVGTDTNQDFTVGNQYRSTGLIKDPKAYNSESAFTDVDGSACFVIGGDFVFGDVNLSDTITDVEGKRFFVVAKPASDPGDPCTVLVQSLDDETPEIGDVITYGISEATLVSVSAPTVDKYSGLMVFIDNREPYQPLDGQQISFKTFLRF